MRIRSPFGRVGLWLALGSLLQASLGGGTGWETLGPQGAVIEDLIRDPFEPQTLYAAARHSIFKSTDGGQTWRDSGRGLPFGFGQRLAADPLHRGVLYAAYSSARVYKSSDGGQTWTLSKNGLPSFGSITSLAVDGSTPQRIYAAGSIGLYQSEDGAQNWTRPNNPVAQGNLSAFTIHRANSHILIATDLTGVHKSSNRGQIWTKVSDDLITSFVSHPGAPNRIHGLRRNALSGSKATLFVSQDAGSSWQTLHVFEDAAISLSSLSLHPQSGLPLFLATNQGIWRSANGGAAWGLINGESAFRSAPVLLPDPSDAANLKVGTSGRGVYQTLDSGATWRQRSFQMVANNIFAWALDPSEARNLYVHAQPEILRSGDGGTSWQAVSAQSGFGALAVHPTDSNTVFLIALDPQAGWVLRRSQNQGSTWVQLGLVSGEAFEINFFTRLLVDPQDANRMYASGFGTTGAGGVFRSINGGLSWSKALASGDLDPLVFDPTNPAVLYAGSGNIANGRGVFKSTNKGDSWQQMNSGLTDLNVADLAVDPRNPQQVYALTWFNGMFRSTNGGMSWSPFLIDGQPVARIGFHPLEEVAYATYSGMAWRRRGQGPWQPIGSPTGGLGSYLFDPQDPVAVLTFNGRGLYRYPAPLWLFAPGDPSRSGGRFDGLAFSNSTAFDANVELTSSSPASPALVQDLPGEASTKAAQKIGPRAAGTSTSLLLGAGKQVAKVRSEIFGGDPQDSAWIQALADTEVATFFQYGAGDLSRLDGGVAVETPSRRLIFRQVFEGPNAYRGQLAQTRLSLFNPGIEAVSATLRYVRQPSEGGSNPAPAIRQIPAGGFIDIRASTLFGASLKGGFVEVETDEGLGLVGFQVVEFPAAGTLLGMNAVTETHHLKLFSAQFATVPGALFTDLNLINTALGQRRVTLRAFRDDGQPIGDEVERDLQPGESVTLDAGLLFPGAGVFVGSLQASVDGEGVTGGVIFGEPTLLQFAAALLLQSEPFTEAIFSQVANLPGVFFTGLAFFYPDPIPASPSSAGSQVASAEVVIEVIRADGSVAGRATRLLQPGRRISALVDEFIPATTGQTGATSE